MNVFEKNTTSLLGEFIPVSFDINNRGNSAVNIKATLMEKHIFIANKRKKEVLDKHLLAEGPVIESGKQIINILQVPIPVNARPSLKCSLIEVKYFVSIHIDDNSSGVKFDFPVIILDHNYDIEIE